MKSGRTLPTASQRIMLATEHERTDAVGDIVHQSASVMPRLENARVELARVALQGGRRWRRAGGSLLCLPDPLSNQKVYGGFGRPAVGIRKKRQTKTLWEWKRGEMRHPRYESVNAAQPTISIPDRRLIPASAHEARSLFVVVMILHHVPAVRAEADQ